MSLAAHDDALDVERAQRRLRPCRLQRTYLLPGLTGA